MWLRDLELLENNITYTPINITQKLSLTKLYKSYCIFNVSNKMPIKQTHRKVAKILIQDPSVLAVEFLANQTEFGTKATIEEMNLHRKKVVPQDPDYDPELELKLRIEREQREAEQKRLEEERRKEEELDAKEEAEELEEMRREEEARRNQTRKREAMDEQEAEIRKGMGLDDDELPDDPEDDDHDDNEPEEEDINAEDSKDTPEPDEEFKEKFKQQRETRKKKRKQYDSAQEMLKDQFGPGF